MLVVRQFSKLKEQRLMKGLCSVFRREQNQDQGGGGCIAGNATGNELAAAIVGSLLKYAAAKRGTNRGNTTVAHSK